MGRKVGFDEDEMREFKGHLNFTKEQIPPHAHDPVYDRPSRQLISKTINAMLNTTSGGTIYLGISFVSFVTITKIFLNCTLMSLRWGTKWQQR